MKSRVQVAVIPAAGRGSRFLPLTKAIPKELLPVVDRPVIHYVVLEALEAGVEHIVMVVAPGKGALEEYFAEAPVVERALREQGRRAQALELGRLTRRGQFSFVVQEEPKGLGHAVLCAREAVGRQPFAVLLPDDLMVGSEPPLAQLLREWRQRPASYVAVEEVPWERVSAYGVVKPAGDGGRDDRVLRVGGLVEKPRREEAPSNLGIVGRYVLMPEVFSALEETRPGAIGEVQLTDALARLAEREPVYAYRLSGTRLDCGTPLGLLRASLVLALGRRDTAREVRRWLREMGE
ncbi:MAG: UTP--glucose-1-phosphate uridylyltransferase [Chloroflexi bacterium]|nr:UTP--glucose-1-phosphate uridylyltransferase [Chloroflexota bacterium]